MAASTELNTILRGSQELAPKDDVSDLPTAVLTYYTHAIGRYLQTKAKGFSLLAFVSCSEYP